MKALNEQDLARLKNQLETTQKRAENFIGYPIATDFDYSELNEFLKYPLNNVGDPFLKSTYDLNSRQFECEVIEFFAKLFRAKTDDWWGYVTNGGSEGNLYALYTARELHPKGMVYFSESTHYSVQKNVHLLALPSITIRSQENGEIDYDDLKESIKLHRHVPAIILANIGTTMTEAKDDVSKIRDILKSLAVKNNYIHCDGALAGVYSALLPNKPSFDFVDGADSIAISGHKFIGSPIPCGVVLVKKTNRDRIARAVSYVGTMDTTITGSRNGHSPLFLWYAIKKLGIEGLKKRIQNSLLLAEMATDKLNNIGIKVWRNKDAITVVFPYPGAVVAEKWHLASENGFSHIICMPGTSEKQIDLLINDLREFSETPNKELANVA